MKVKDYSYETFPRYTVNIDGALELKGNKENLRCRMKDVEYQKGCMIRFLFPNTILDEERKYPLVIHIQGSGWYKQDMIIFLILCRLSKQVMCMQLLNTMVLLNINIQRK